MVLQKFGALHIPNGLRILRRTVPVLENPKLLFYLSNLLPAVGVQGNVLAAPQSWKAGSTKYVAHIPCLCLLSSSLPLLGSRISCLLGLSIAMTYSQIFEITAKPVLTWTSNKLT